MQSVAANGTGNERTIWQAPAGEPPQLLKELRCRLRGKSFNGISIHWPASDPGRAKKVISRSGVRRRYVVPCFRYGDREAHCEAAEEAAACILLDACSGVEFQEQPARLEFVWLGKTHKHLPDLLVACESRLEFWECKRELEAQNFWTRKRTERLRELLTPAGIGYRVVSGKELYAEAYLENARVLRRFAKQSVSDTARLEAKLRLGQGKSFAIEQLATSLGGAEPIGDILALIYHGDLRIDLHEKLTKYSLVHSPLNKKGLPWVWQLLNVDNV